jgi:hypothetical protein
MPGEWRENDPGNPVWLEPQFARSTTSTSILTAFRPPSRHKARNLDHFRLICHAEGFVEAVKRGGSNQDASNRQGRAEAGGTSRDR